MRANNRNVVRIAAVVEDLRLSDITADPPPGIFLPLGLRHPGMSVSAFVASEERPQRLAQPMRRAVVAISPELPVFDVRTARAAVDQQFAERDAMARAASTLGLTGLLPKDPAARPASGAALPDAVTDAQVVRAEIAPSIREFLASGRTAAAQAIGLGTVWFGVLEVIPRIVPRPGLPGHPLDPAIGIRSAVTVIVALMPLRSARGVRRAGLDERDVARAVVANSMVLDVNVDYEAARAHRLSRRLGHPAARAVFAGLAGVIVWWITKYGLLPSIQHDAMVRAVAMALNIAVNAGFLLSLAIAPTKVVALFTRGTAEQSGALRRFWEGIVGRGLFRVAGIGLSGARAARPATPGRGLGPGESPAGSAATARRCGSPG
ncbi:MAG: hypothetical protein WD801_03575 [Gemmatimonadaceae bacterium]